MSPLLNRLEAEIRTELDPVQRGKLLARRGGYLARIGRFDDARQQVVDLRREFADARSGAVTSWIMLAEALIHHFENLDVQALDRMARAQLLSLATGDGELAAMSSAWKAHFEFERSRFDAMAQSLQLALTHAGANDHAARSRLAMVLCNAFFLCGERQSAQAWFLSCREHALKEGDQASIEALLYNRAAFSLAWLRSQQCLDQPLGDTLAQVRSELNSARNLQALTGVQALANVVPLCEARASMLEGHYDAAIGQLEALRQSTPFGPYNFNPCLLQLEVAWCRLCAGRLRPQDAGTAFDWAPDLEVLDLDEQLAAAWMIQQAQRAGGPGAALDAASARLQALRAGYQQQSGHLSNLLAPFRRA